MQTQSVIHYYDVKFQYNKRQIKTIKLVNTQTNKDYKM